MPSPNILKLEGKLIRRVLKSRRTRQALRKAEARSFNHCCSGKTLSITISEFLFVAFVLQHATRTRHILICGLPGSTTSHDFQKT
jgi:hypothetical protein